MGRPEKAFTEYAFSRLAYLHRTYSARKQLKNNLTGHKKKKEILSLFEKLGISDKLNVKAGKLSFGQQQRVAFIRAFCQPFDFLFLDEPISHLDDENSRIMGEIIIDEAGKQGAGVIATSIGKHIELPYKKVLQL